MDNSGDNSGHPSKEIAINYSKHPSSGITQRVILEGDNSGYSLIEKKDS
jgi:hypothetical protein